MEVNVQIHAAADLPSEKKPTVSIGQEAWWAPLARLNLVSKRGIPTLHRVSIPIL